MWSAHKAAVHSRQHADQYSQRRCAEFVSKSIRSGGANLQNTLYAKDMKSNLILAILLLPTLASAAQKFPPEVSASLQFNKWYISQIIIGKEPLKNYEALRPYVTRETISKLKAMDKLDPDEYDVPDVDMFIKAQGYEDDWGIVSARALDYDAACMQVYISFGKKRDHTVIDCMVKEDGVWKVESVASMNISDNLMME
ncbi:DUF3828 domain-containing protein [Enterobacter hormaechei]